MIINLSTKLFKQYHSNKKHLSEFYPQYGSAKTSWHRYGTKLRHCHPMYISLGPCPIASTDYFRDHKEVRVYKDRQANLDRPNCGEMSTPRYE